MTVRDLEPRAFWGHFADLSAVPRASFDEARARDLVKAKAEAWGLKWNQDRRGNLAVYKPASPGREGRPAVVLQAHLDMVCEQDRGGTHDFASDPLDLYVEGGWVKARGTTLGADNGVGVAEILTLLGDPTLVHGPLEALFTVDEEQEMTGAEQLDPSLVTGRLLLNLDGEGPGHFVAGSAGGGVVTGTVPLTLAPADAPAAWKVSLGGLAGGHSGVEIHRGQGNALVLLARFLDGFLGRHGGAWQLITLEGGDKDNAIPREAEARLAGPADGSALAEACAAFRALAAAELGDQAPGGLGLDLTLEAEPSAPGEPVLTPADQQRLLDLVTLMPTGVLAMSQVVPGLVDTSANLGKLRVEDGLATVVVSPRSGSMGRLADVIASVGAVIRLAGGTVGRSPTFPAWTAPAESRLREVAASLWTATTGQAAVVELVHAGLECGWWAHHWPGIDMISYGPDLIDIHTPRERVSSASVADFHRFTVALLEAL